MKMLRQWKNEMLLPMWVPNDVSRYFVESGEVLEERFDGEIVFITRLVIKVPAADLGLEVDESGFLWVECDEDGELLEVKR